MDMAKCIDPRGKIYMHINLSEKCKYYLNAYENACTCRF